jgi:hypothetical protein
VSCITREWEKARLNISLMDGPIAELKNERYRVSPARRVYEAYVEQLERARMFEGVQGLEISNGYRLAAVRLQV